MKLQLKRDRASPRQTLGVFSIDGKFECYTLEDVVREISGQPVMAWKIPGETAIPRGTYPVTITPSERFGKPLPLLGDVSGFSGVRIHAGNTEADTEGCILLGDIRLATYISASRIAVARVQPKIQAALDRGETVTLTIE